MSTTRKDWQQEVAEARATRHPIVVILEGRLLDKTWKPTVPDVLPSLYAYRDKEGSGAGGCLRPMLSGNERDSDIEADRRQAEKDGDTDGIVLCNALLRMSRTQRSKLGNLFYVYGEQHA